jgi:alpha-tubulin suppressor-like RCC1 family protein
MKNKSIKFTSLTCMFVFLLLPLLVNPTAVGASQTSESIPVESSIMRNAASVTAGSEMGPIAAGWNHTCALTSSGGVMCWGQNNYGQLGNNSTIDSPIPVYVVGLSSGVIAIAAGNWHTCALTTTGGVKCWGGNLSGQLGNNSFNNSGIPVSVWGLSSGVSAITAGFYHTCALTMGGMMCWGYNGYGQLGNDTYTNGKIPQYVNGLSNNVSAIAAGFYHTCALPSTGGVKCWGRNNFAQLGNNSTTDNPTPVNVSGLSSEMRAITAGDWHTCVAIEAGGVKCWGSNNGGQLGNDFTTMSLVPMDVSGFTDVANSLAAGGFHTCALTTGGGVKCWGSNANGQLGDNNSMVGSITPVDVVGLSSGVSAITAGQLYSCAFTTTGGLKCWGSNGYGQLGNNSTTQSDIPVDVAVPAPPQLTINYNTGQPGSTFTIIGENFPASSTVSISANSYVFSDTVTVNSTGGFTFFLDTTNADLGFYTVSTSSIIHRGAAEAMESQVETSANPGVAIFLLDDSAPLRSQSGSGQILSIPAGIAIPPHWLYLPLAVR